MRRAALAVAFGALIGCSSSGNEDGKSAGGSGSASAGAAGVAGSANVAGAAGAGGVGGALSSGGASAGASAAGTAALGGSGGVSAGAGGGASGGATGGATVGGSAGAAGASGNFVCSEVLGLTLTKEWYMAGFEKGVVDARWQLKAAQSAYVDEWAKMDSPFWATPLVSPCQASSTSPDHVVFAVLSWTIMAQGDWETAIKGAVAGIQAKYTGIRRIDLMTIIRGPNNMACGDPNTYTENTHIPAALDAALQTVAQGAPNLVHAAPGFAVDACSDYTGVGPHLTAAGNAKLAAKIAAAFASAP
jgi:hypothetical protein